MRHPAFALFAALTSGRPFLGIETVPFRAGETLKGAERKTGVLLLSEERGDSLQDKRRRFSLGEGVHLLMRHQVGAVEWPAVVAQAKRYCHANGCVLVVDTFDRWTGLKGEAENRAGDIIEALDPLNDAAASELAVLVIAHQRKSFGETEVLLNQYSLIA